jgi:hypothetical protein
VLVLRFAQDDKRERMHSSDYRRDNCTCTSFTALNSPCPAQLPQLEITQVTPIGRERAHSPNDPFRLEHEMRCSTDVACSRRPLTDEPEIVIVVETSLARGWLFLVERPLRLARHRNLESPDRALIVSLLVRFGTYLIPIWSATVHFRRPAVS